MASPVFEIVAKDGPAKPPGSLTRAQRMTHHRDLATASPVHGLALICGEGPWGPSVLERIDPLGLQKNPHFRHLRLIIGLSGLIIGLNWLPNTS